MKYFNEFLFFVKRLVDAKYLVSCLKKIVGFYLKVRILFYLCILRKENFGFLKYFWGYVGSKLNFCVGSVYVGGKSRFTRR